MLPELRTLTYRGNGFVACLVSPYGADEQKILSNEMARTYLRTTGGRRVFVPSSDRSARARVAALDTQLVPAAAFPQTASNTEASFLLPGDGFAMWGGGCMLVVAQGGGHTLAAHCSRYSLIPEAHITELEQGASMESLGKPPRDLLGVIADAFEARGVPRTAVSVWGFWGIDSEIYTHPPDDPLYGQRNQALISYTNRWWPGCIVGKAGNLSMGALFFAHAERAGFTTIEYHGPLPRDGWFPTTRDPDHARRTHRYLAVVAMTQ